jgi:hypothetical protein
MTQYRVLVGDYKGELAHIVMSMDGGVALLYKTAQIHAKGTKHPMDHMNIEHYDGNANTVFMANHEDAGMIAAADLCDEAFYAQEIPEMMKDYEGCTHFNGYSEQGCGCTNPIPPSMQL